MIDAPNLARRRGPVEVARIYLCRVEDEWECSRNTTQPFGRISMSLRSSSCFLRHLFKALPRLPKCHYPPDGKSPAGERLRSLSASGKYHQGHVDLSVADNVIAGTRLYPRMNTKYPFLAGAFVFRRSEMKLNLKQKGSVVNFKSTSPFGDLNRAVLGAILPFSRREHISEYSQQDRDEPPVRSRDQARHKR
jgi:hypothetical protein